MISYFFAYNISSNATSNTFPADKAGKYAGDIEKAVKSLKAKSLAKDSRGKKLFESGETFMYQKMTKDVLVCSISQEVKTEGDMYRLFVDFYDEAEKKKAFAKDGLMKEWLSEEIGKYNAGERISKGAKVNKRMEKMNEKIGNRINIEMDKFDDLMAMNEDMLDMEQDAKEAKQLATEVHTEAWWYNKRMGMLLFGSIGTIVMVILVVLFAYGIL